MECSQMAGCKREFRLSQSQKDQALLRAFKLDMARGDIPGRYPYRWSAMKTNLIVNHFSEREQHWFHFTEDEGIPGVRVHIIVYIVVGQKLQYSIDERRHEQAEMFFRGNLLVENRLTITVPMDDLEQDRVLLRASMDEEELPEAWKPRFPPPSATTPPPPPGYK